MKRRRFILFAIAALLMMAVVVAILVLRHARQAPRNPPPHVEHPAAIAVKPVAPRSAPVIEPDPVAVSSAVAAVCGADEATADRYEARNDVFGNMTNEVQNGTVIARDYDAFDRPIGYVLSGGAGGSPADVGSPVAYSYDPIGRFASVTFGTDVFEYLRLPCTDLVSGYTCGSFSRSVSYEPHRDLISAVTNAFNASTPSTISTFDYTNDAAPDICDNAPRSQP